MEQTGTTGSITELHQALRENRKADAQRIATELRESYRHGDHPRSLLAFIESVLAESGGNAERHKATPAQHSPAGPQPFQWRMLPGANQDRIRRALGLWNRLVPEGQQLCIPGERTPAVLASGEINAEGIGQLLIDSTGSLPWLDAWYTTTHQLRLRSGSGGQRGEGSQVMHWEALQWQPQLQRLMSCGCVNLEEQAESLHDVNLHQPLAPLLLLGGDGAGGVVEAILLPFPSMLRHGVHHGEVVAELPSRASTEAIRAHSLSCLLRLLQGSWPRVRSFTIRPPKDCPGGWIGRASVQHWLAQMCALEPPPNEFTQPELHLQIDADGLPSVRALTGLAQRSERELTTEASYVVVDPIHLGPLLRIRPGRQPEAAHNCVHVHHAGKEKAAYQCTETIAVLIAGDTAPRRRPLWCPEDATTLTKGSETNRDENRPIDVALTNVTNADELQFSLWSISQQQHVKIDRLWLPGLNASNREALERSQSLLNHMTAEGVSIEYQSDEDLLALLEDSGSKQNLLCLMKAGVCLHEPATLKVLAAMLIPEEVASAGCLMIHEHQQGRQHTVEAYSCGLMPGKIEPVDSSELELVQQTLIHKVGLEERSVIANLSDLVLVEPNERHWNLTKTSGFLNGKLEERWLHASVGAILSGSLHRTTARISAHYQRAPKADQHYNVTLEGYGVELATAIPRLLAASTCSQRLKP